jgi:hypothetical protein
VRLLRKGEHEPALLAQTPDPQPEPASEPYAPYEPAPSPPRRRPRRRRRTRPGISGAAGAAASWALAHIAEFARRVAARHHRRLKRLALIAVAFVVFVTVFPMIFNRSAESESDRSRTRAMQVLASHRPRQRRDPLRTLRWPARAARHAPCVRRRPDAQWRDRGNLPVRGPRSPAGPADDRPVRAPRSEAEVRRAGEKSGPAVHMSRLVSDVLAVPVFYRSAPSISRRNTPCTTAAPEQSLCGAHRRIRTWRNVTHSVSS